jgi:hypothetical protein
LHSGQWRALTAGEVKALMPPQPGDSPGRP